MGRIIVFTSVLALATGTASATTLTLTPTTCGESEREFAAAPCAQEPAFLAGTSSAAANLQAGGSAYGCDSEWASSFEFDLAPVPAEQTILTATLVVRKTGYADDAQGFPYIAAFAYAATGSAVSVPRADLNPTTALGVLYPPVANVDISFDVTDAVQDLLDETAGVAGFLLAGVYSEAGYENRIYLGGATNTAPPRLVIVYNEPVADTSSSWSSVKALYR